MEPSLQPSFTFPSRHQVANIAVGLESLLNQTYVNSVPARATDISIETGLNSADLIVPTGRKETLDPEGTLPISENIYVQPGTAEGLTNVSEKDNAELTIMKTLSSNNALKRGNYQAAEHILGRGTTVEEIQNQTTVPHVRSSQLGGPDVAVGLRSQHIGVPIRSGPNNAHMAHIISQLGNQIDVLGQQYNIPVDQLVRLKTRYNLFTPADPTGNIKSAGWKSTWELIKRDLEGLRTRTDNIQSNVQGTGNAQRQAEQGHNAANGSRGVHFSVPGTHASAVVNEEMLGGKISRGEKVLHNVLRGGTITRSGKETGRIPTPYERKVTEDNDHKMEVDSSSEPIEIHNMDETPLPSLKHIKNIDNVIQTVKSDLKISEKITGEWSDHVANHWRWQEQYIRTLVADEGDQLTTTEKKSLKGLHRSIEKALARHGVPVINENLSYEEDRARYETFDTSDQSFEENRAAYYEKMQQDQTSAQSSQFALSRDDQDQLLPKPPGNSTSDFQANNQTIAQEQDAMDPAAQANYNAIANIGPSREIPPSANPIIQEYVVDSVPLGSNAHPRQAFMDRDAIYTQYQQKINQGLRHPAYASGGLNGNFASEYIPEDREFDLSTPRNWSASIQLQEPESHTIKQVSTAKKADYILRGPSRLTDHRNYTMDAHTYATNRYHAAPLTQALMNRTGHDAVPISAQIQTSSSNNHALFEPNVRQFAKEPFRTENLVNAFMPQPPPQEMYSKNPQSVESNYGTYDNTVPQGTGRNSKANTRVPFGRHFIHIDKLFQQGVVSLSHANGKKVTRIKNQSVARGSGLHTALCCLTSGRAMPKKLSKEDQAKFHTICDRSGVHHPDLVAGAVNVDPLQQLHIAMGEVNAGNDSAAVRMDIRRLLKQVEGMGKLGRAHISDIRTAYLS